MIVPARLQPPARPIALPQVRGGLGVGLVVVPLALAGALATTNPELTCAAVLSLALMVRLLWHPGMPPVLLFICFMQWLQGALQTLHADFLGVELWTLSYARHIEEASYYTLGWVSTIAIGAYLVTRRLPSQSPASATGVTLSLRRLLVVYGVATVALQILEVVMPSQGKQVVTALATLRWALVFTLFTYGWSASGGWVIAVGVLAAEVMVGFLSFFSDFKAPLFVFAIALVSVGYRPTARQYAVLAAVSVLTLYLGVVWSSIKIDYRNELSGGQGHRVQQVVIDTEERIEAFVSLVGSLDNATLGRGAEALVSRLAYVEYFAYVLGYVPRVAPHEGGRIWLNALAHVFMPRILFPDKPALESDTVITERYTGLSLGGSNTGTSITVGLPAETYVDLGPGLMFVVPLLLGIMYGAGYRYLMLERHAGPLAQGAAVALLISYTSVGSASTKVLGGYLSMLIITLVLWRLGSPILVRFLRVQVR